MMSTDRKLLLESGYPPTGEAGEFQKRGNIARCREVTVEWSHSNPVSGRPMPITFQIDRDAGIVRTRLSGQFSAPEVTAYRDRLLSDPDYRPGMLGFVDCREIESLPSADALQLLALEITRRQNTVGTTRVAVVVASEAAYGLMRMYEVYTAATSIKVKVFREEAEALSWLTGPGTAS